jgi:hypothetical protein
MHKKNRSPISLVEITTGLARQQALWEPLVSYDPVARYYIRLAREHEFEAWLLAWLPGQGTDWHGGSAGAFITLRGVLTERHAEVGYALRESFQEIESWWRERCAPLVPGIFTRSPTAEWNPR